MQKVDLAVVALPKRQVLDVVDKLTTLDKARAIQVISGGFEEFGDRTLKELAETAKIPIQGSNVVGNVVDGKNLTFMHFRPKPLRREASSGICSELNECDLDCLNCTNNADRLNGKFFTNGDKVKKLAVVSQSGAVLSAFAAALPVSTGLSVGNSSQL